MGYLELNGLYRIFGHSLVIFGTMNHPFLPGILAIFTHSVTVFLFFRVSQIILGSSFLSLTLSLLMAIFPWGYQCMVWIPARAFILATAFFLANVLFFVNPSSGNRNQVSLFLITYCLTWLSLLSFEGLLFSLALCGCILWIPREGKFSFEEVKKRVLKCYAGWAPPLACLSYAVSYILVRRYFVSEPPQKTFLWNPESIFSVYFHQWSNIHMFQPWFNPTLRKFVFYGWNNGWLIALACLSPLLVVCLSLVVRTMFNEKTITGKPGKILLLYIALLLIGASLIYAVGGGYSLDNRKKYPLIPLLLLLFGWSWRNVLESKIKISNKSLLFLLVLCAVGAGTTWLNTGIWQYEAARYNSLTDFLVTHNIAGNIRIKWEPDLYKAWPTLATTWGSGMDEEGVLNPAILYKRGQPIHVTQAADAKTIEFDPSSSSWKLAE